MSRDFKSNRSITLLATLAFCLSFGFASAKSDLAQDCLKGTGEKKEAACAKIAKIGLRSGFSFARKGDHTRAVRDYGFYIQYYPSVPEAYLLRSISLGKLGRKSEAEADFNAAIKLSERGEAPVYYVRGRMYADLKHYDVALLDFDKAINYDTRYAEAYVERGRIYGRKGQFERALSDLNHAINLKPSLWSAYALRGLVHRDNKSYEKAVADFDLAIRLNPKDVQSYNGRGIAHYELGHREKSISDFRKSNQLKPGNLTAVRYLKSLGVDP